MQDKAAWNKSLEESGIYINGVQVDVMTLQPPISVEQQNSLSQSALLQNAELRVSALVLQHELEESDVEIEGALTDFVLHDITAYPIEGTRLYLELAQPSGRNQKAARNRIEGPSSVDFWVWIATDSVTQIDNLIVIKGKCAPAPSPELNAQTLIQPTTQERSRRGCLNLFSRHP